MGSNAKLTVEVRDPRFKDVVGDAVDIAKVGSGYLFTEGPIWHPVEKHLTFSDIPDNCMYRWTAEDGVVTFRRPSNMANGNVYDPEYHIVTCEHATSRVTRTESDGTITVLASHFKSKELNSPNDVIVKSDGTIYFTDPAFGRREFFGKPREQELDIQGVYRIAPEDGSLHLIADDFEQPNGLCLSLDEIRLFVNDTSRGHIRVFNLLPDGNVRGGDVWAKPEGEGDGVSDGLKVDSLGNVYCTGPGGIHVFDPDATCLGVILLPEKTANFNWGEDDMRTLFTTSSTSVYRLRVKVPGRQAYGETRP